MLVITGQTASIVLTFYSQLNYNCMVTSFLLGITRFHNTVDTTSSNRRLKYKASQINIIKKTKNISFNTNSPGHSLHRQKWSLTIVTALWHATSGQHVTRNTAEICAAILMLDVFGSNVRWIPMYYGEAEVNPVAAFSSVWCGCCWLSVCSEAQINPLQAVVSSSSSIIHRKNLITWLINNIHYEVKFRLLAGTGEHFHLICSLPIWNSMGCSK